MKSKNRPNRRSKTTSRKAQDELKKNLHDFHWSKGTDINTMPEYVVYRAVPFSELTTHALLKLLRSFRKFGSELYEHKYHAALKRELAKRPH